MRRRWFAVVGVLVLALDLVLALGIVPTTAALATAGLIGVGGLLLVAGGLDLLGETLPWYRLVGVAEVLFGAVFVVTWIPPALGGDPTTTQVVLALVGAVNGLVLGLIGVDWINGGDFFDLSIYEAGPIFGGSDASEPTAAERDDSEGPSG